MTKLTRIAFVSLTISVAIAASMPLSVKPGGWEITTTTMVSGNPIPPSALAQMPPAQRAKMEAMFKARAAKPHTMVSKSCITLKDLKDSVRSPFGHDDDKTCKSTVISATGTEWQAAIVCTGEDARKGTMKITAVSPTQMKNVVEMTTGTSKSTMTQTGQWKSASCAGYED